MMNLNLREMARKIVLLLCSGNPVDNVTIGTRCEGFSAAVHFGLFCRTGLDKFAARFRGALS
jgi:hypothetical protein